MQSVKRACLLAILQALFLATASAELDRASMRTELSYGYGSDSASSMQGTLEMFPELSFDLRSRTRAMLSARIRLDSEDLLEPGRPSLDSYANWSRPIELGNAGTAELRDLYLEWQGERGLFRLGKQQIAWGRLDGLKILDVVNPQEFREFILDDLGDSRIGQWSAYLDYPLGAWRAELALVPDTTSHSIPDAGAWFELTAPRFRLGAPPDAEDLPPVVGAYDHDPGDGAAGLRLSRYLGRIDLSLVAYSGRDHEPLARIAEAGGQPAVARYTERRNLFGLSAETGFGRFVVRGEYAYQPDRFFNTRDEAGPGVARLEQHRAAVGVDIDGPLGFFVNVQFLVDVVRSAPTSLLRPERDEIATLFLRRSFAHDRVAMELRWYHSPGEGDDALAFAIDYDVGADTVLRLAAETFHGSPRGLFGQFERRDRIVLGLQHTF